MVQSYSTGGANLPSYVGTLANTIELVLPSDPQSPQPKLQIDRYSHFCTAHGKKSLYFTMVDPFPKNCPFSWGICTPMKYMIPWAYPSSKPKWYLDRFSCFCTVHCRLPILYNEPSLPPSKLLLPIGGCGPPSNT